MASISNGQFTFIGWTDDDFWRAVGLTGVAYCFWQLFSNGSIWDFCLYIPLQWFILITLNTLKHSYIHSIVKSHIDLQFLHIVQAIIQEARLVTWVRKSLCASVLSDRFLLKWRRRLVTLGDWHHLGDLGDRGVSRGACQGLWEPGEEDCTWLELNHAGTANGDS